MLGLYRVKEDFIEIHTCIKISCFVICVKFVNSQINKDNLHFSLPVFPPVTTTTLSLGKDTAGNDSFEPMLDEQCGRHSCYSDNPLSIRFIYD